jgi:hypothetical protein
MATIRLEEAHLKVPLRAVEPSEVVAWLSTNGFRSLSVAGNRVSNNPGIGEPVERVESAVLHRSTH